MRRLLACIGLALASGLLPLDALGLSCSQYSSYRVEGGRVIYQRNGEQRILRGIDARTFRHVTAKDPYRMCMAGFAKDARTVLYEGERIPSAHADSFQEIGAGWRHYAKDRNRVYAGAKMISDAVDQFRVLDSGYATDGKAVFYGATRLPGKNLVGLGYVYAKTEAAVFYEGRTLDGLDPASFQIFENRPSYGRDGKTVVFDGEPIRGADPASFEIIAPTVDHTRDRKHVYHNGKIVAGADPATIRQISGYYFRDARAVYLSGRKIEGADPATFRVARSGFHSFDRNRVFRLHEVVPNLDPATFEELCVNERAKREFAYCR